MSRRYFENGNLDLIAGRHVTDKQLDSASNHAIANRIVTAEFGKVEDRLDLNNCRNILYPTELTTTRNGVTMICNKDGSITLKGSSTTDSNMFFEPFPYINGYVFLKNGSYKLGGDVVGGRIRTVSGQTYKTDAYFIVMKSRTSELIANSDVEGWADVDIDGDYTLQIYLVINSGANFGNGMTIYPMLVAESTDDVTSFEQGELSNRELTIASRELYTDLFRKQSISLSQSIAGETTVEGALSAISTNLTNKLDKGYSELYILARGITINVASTITPNNSDVLHGGRPDTSWYIPEVISVSDNLNHHTSVMWNGNEWYILTDVVQNYTVRFYHMFN